MKYFIKDDFYFDIDSDNQLRITGPENHLFLGVGFPEGIKVDIHTYDIEDEQLVIRLSVNTTKLSLPLPLVADMRTLRQHTEGKKPKPKYKNLVENNVVSVLPRSVNIYENDGETEIELVNSYEEEGELKQYGAKMVLHRPCRAELTDQKLNINCKDKVVITIRTVTNIRPSDRIEDIIFSQETISPPEMFDQEIAQMFQEAHQQVEFLVRTKKTSSFEYGTIFPRDWIESADLGIGDLTRNAIDYMYGQSMKYISERGEGWHEEVVGEFKVKMKGQAELVDRKMIDIEPHYIMGIPRVSRQFLLRDENKEKFIRVAQYVINKARENQFIKFKQVSEESDEYYDAGNWRDGKNAFADQKPPVAPYDVNCVFYPVSLGVIRDYHEYLGIEDLDELNELIGTWSSHKDKFRLYHPNGIIGYSLALHGKKNLPMPVAHLDESYDLFYGTPSMEDVVSFAKKIVDPDYFYTPVGPILVSSDADQFNTKQYHGKVIWPKQTAFAVAGLARQYRYALTSSWPETVLDVIKNAVIKTSEATFRGIKELGAVPELYYYDSDSDSARFYTDQEDYDGQMSLIQLWSSVGFRRIVLDYHNIM